MTAITKIEDARQLMDVVLNKVRAAREELGAEPCFGGRELALAITHFETGCMWMIRSQFAETPYSPLTRLKKVE